MSYIIVGGEVILQGKSGYPGEITIDNELLIYGKSKIIDNDGHIAKISADGRILVDAQSVVIPVGATEAKVTEFKSVGATDYNSYYIIPTGKALYIQILEGGAEVGSLGNRVSLYYQPNGSATGEVLITLPIQVNGNSYIKTINWTCPDLGNGTRRIALRLHRNDGTPTRYIGGEWKGYYL